MTVPIIDLAFYQSPLCREQIISAAIMLYARRGKTAVSFSETAAAAGVPLSVVEWHFTDETELQAQVLQRFFRWLLPRALLASQRRFRLAQRAFSEEEMIQTFFRVLSRMLQRYRGLFSEDLRLCVENHLPVKRRSLFYELLENFAPELAATISAGQAKGCFTTRLDQGTGTTLLKSLVNGGATQCVMLETAEAPSFYFDRLCEQALNLLAAEPREWQCWAD